MFIRYFLVCSLLLAAFNIRVSSGAPTGNATETDNGTIVKPSGGTGTVNGTDVLPGDGGTDTNIDPGNPAGTQLANKNTSLSLDSGDTKNKTDQGSNNGAGTLPVSDRNKVDAKENATINNDTTEKTGSDGHADTSHTEKPKGNGTDENENDKNKPDKEMDKQSIETGETNEDKNENKDTVKKKGSKGGDQGTGTEQGSADKGKITETKTALTESSTSATSTTELTTTSSWPAGDADSENKAVVIDSEHTKPKDDKGKQKTEGDKGDKGVKAADNQQKSQPVVSEDYSDEFEGSSSGHFMAYFLTATVLCIAGYVIFHNKQKIIAFIVEGRNTPGRRPSTKTYQKLKTKVDDVMPSLEKSTTSSNYVY